MGCDVRDFKMSIVKDCERRRSGGRPPNRGEKRRDGGCGEKCTVDISAGWDWRFSLLSFS